jgi:hypothetical protein
VPRSDIDTKQITKNKAICLPRSARFGFDIGGFKKDFLAAGLVVFANKA